MGTPGWCTQLSPSRDAPFLYVAPQVRRLHVFPSGISSEGSSDSDSGGGGGGVDAVGVTMGARGMAGSSCVGVDVPEAGASFFSICGGRSVVLCFPSVHGGMVMNSSNVSTRGLQHFHPSSRGYSLLDRDSLAGGASVWAEMLPHLSGPRGTLEVLDVLADLVFVRVLLVAALVNAPLRHRRLEAAAAERG